MDNGARRGRPTLATVAASAGVSVATVSKVLNGRSDVAADTRARVQDVLQQHQYVAPAPRRAEGHGTPTVELVFDYGLHAYTGEVVQGVLDAAVELGVTITVSSGPRRDRVQPTPESPSAWARRIAAAGRRAVVAITGELTATHLAALDRAKVPVVVIDPLNPQLARLTSVGATNFAGGMTAGEHLLALGHRRIGYAGGTPTAACNQARVGGLRAALEAQGLPLPPEYVTAALFDYGSGFEGGAQLLDLPEPPTAIFAGSDEVALGVIEAARVRGMRVPQDLSVMGFDDTQLARMASPPLTTIRQPLSEMGAVALRTALRLAAGETIDSHHVELATRLVVRGSTAAPAG
ncbi:LacI family DNA-binding transcriptional regulator [Kineosporia sp. R_H_3]|uniref:LacI family DNA-binding transcriptional regulator n=1 Tax=Kineosporia sp. R_H_3 TaxID=1961848 RepID=UPI000B4A55DC|nr:LacI family DNA-binding transcriptional regulator [Kineosporia sp. R_H_3]